MINSLRAEQGIEFGHQGARMGETGKPISGNRDRFRANAKKGRRAIDLTVILDRAD